MSYKPPGNYSPLFNLFSSNKPDKTGTILQKIGVVGFAVSFIARGVGNLLPYDGTAFDVLLAIYGISFFVGLFAFLAAAIHYMGLEKGKSNFIKSALYVLKNTLLFLLLPGAVLTAIVIIWAIATKQPAFR